MPSYEREFSDESRKQLLASEHQWFDKGTYLFQAHQMLKDGLQTFESEAVIVGKPIAGRVGNGDYSRLSFEIIPLMLYGMALECWAKGLIVMAIPRASDGVRKITSKHLDSFLEADRDLDDDLYVTRLWEVIKTPEIQKLLDQEKELSLEENEARFKLATAHKKHDLIQLFHEAKIDVVSSEREWLRFFSTAIMMGRYPSLMPKQAMQPWSGVCSKDEVFERLNELVNRRYEDILSANFELE